MKVLITGGAGFIGSHLADKLVARGDQVLLIDNYATGRRDSIAAGPNVEIVEGTIADADTVDRAFDACRPDCVVHAAAAFKDPDAWGEDVRTNALGTVNVIRAAERLGVNRLIYFQTALCYGLHPKQSPIRLDHPICPEGSSYAYSKTVAEGYLSMSSLDYISFRLANGYGPRSMSGPLATFYGRLTSGKPCFVMDTRRDFVYVDDLTDVVVKALDGRGERGAYHVSSGGDVSIKELFDAIVAALGITLDQEVEVRPRTEDDAATILLDPSKTNADFDWCTSTTLEDGVRRAVDYFNEYGVTESYTHLRLSDEAAEPAAAR